MRSSFFQDPTEDDELEPRNEVFWSALVDRIRSDGFVRPPRHVLDIGCHRGGLLARIAELWKPDELVGVEPIESARTRARLRLQTAAPSVLLLDVDEWRRVADGSIDLVVSHEVLFLVPDIEALVAHVGRVLAPQGRAYIAAGCHAENPVWPAWRERLEAMGHRTFSHSPMDVMASAGRSGLIPSVRPLREGGWATHDPRGDFAFPTVGALLDHQFKHKLLFRLVRP
jgi:SAM-dependent methyltransferase